MESLPVNEKSALGRALIPAWCIVFNSLSLNLLLALGLNALVGWWPDPVVALAIAGVAFYSSFDS